MPTYRVSGADRSTGEDVEVVVEASTSDDAVAHANARSVLVSGVMRVEGGIQSVAFSINRGVLTLRLSLASAAALGVLATFLPWVRIPIMGSIIGIQGDGKITLALFAVGLLCALLGGFRKPLHIASRLVIVLMGVLSTWLGVDKIMTFNEMMKSAETEDNPFAGMMMVATRIEVGVYLVIAAGIAMAGVALAYWPRPDQRAT